MFLRRGRVFALMLVFTSLSSVAAEEKMGLTELRVDDLSLALGHLNGSVKFQNIFAKTASVTTHFKAQHFDVSENENTIALDNDFATLSLANHNFTFLKESGILNVDQASLLFKAKEIFQFTTGEAAVELGNGVQEISELALTCKGDLASMGKNILKDCANVLSLRAKELRIDQASSDTVMSIFPEQLLKFYDLKKVKLAPKHFYDILFTSIGGSTNIQLKVKFLLKIKIKVEGTLEDRQDEAQKTHKLILDVHKASAWIFPIKNLLLKAIAKAAIKNLSVSGSKVIFTLK